MTIKLVVISQERCVPCKVLKNQIEHRIEELEELGGEFEYISLDELLDKDTFIAGNGLTCTPTVWIKKDDVIVKEHPGYIDVDTLFETIKEIKEEN